MSIWQLLINSNLLGPWCIGLCWNWNCGRKQFISGMGWTRAKDITGIILHLCCYCLNPHVYHEEPIKPFCYIVSKGAVPTKNVDNLSIFMQFTKFMKHEEPLLAKSGVLRQRLVQVSNRISPFPQFISALLMSVKSLHSKTTVKFINI